MEESEKTVRKSKKRKLQKMLAIATKIKKRKQSKKNQRLNNTNETPIVLDDDSDTECEQQPNSSDSTVLEYGRIRLVKKDYDRLLSTRAWLNDSLMDFFLLYMKEKYDKRDCFYLFNSMFFMKLKRIHKSKSELKEYYQETIAWFKDKTANEKSYWLIPICENKHWYIIVVLKPISCTPTIHVFDSLNDRRKKNDGYSAVELLKSFLFQKFASEKRGTFRKFKIIRHSIPQQENSFDCGLYAIRTAILIFDQNKHYFDAKSIESRSLLINQYPIPSRPDLKKIVDGMCAI